MAIILLFLRIIDSRKSFMNSFQVLVCGCVFVLREDFVNFEVGIISVKINHKTYNYGYKRMEND